MKKHNGMKALLASLLVTLALAGPAAFLTALPTGQNAVLSFQGAEMIYHPADGSYQLLFDVIISGDKLYNSQGAMFSLDYNEEYMTPSDFTTNADLVTRAGTISTDAFFQYNADLARDSGGNSYFPFETKIRENDYSTISDKDGKGNFNRILKMHLQLNQTEIAAKGGGDASSTDLLENLLHVSVEDGTFYVFNARQAKEDGGWENADPVEPITLGRLSFRVQEGKLDEICRYFDGVEGSCTTHGSGSPVAVTLKKIDGSNGDKVTLLDVDRTITKATDRWQIMVFDGSYANITSWAYGPGQSGKYNQNVVDHYAVHFQGKTPVDVAVTEPDFTINAYQNFTDGTVGDLKLSLGRYSPTVTVTYADGSKENLAFYWGENGANYGVKVRDTAGNRVDITTYDPTASDNATNYLHSANAATGGEKGTDYFFTQNFTLSYVDETGTTRSFTKPVTAHMKVTPITVIDVTADDLEKTYSLTDAVKKITAPEALELPEQARIITDVVPGDVALVTDIKGWMPNQAGDKGTTDSKWPGVDASYDSEHFMNSLKGDGYDGNTPYWPEEVDVTAGAPDAGKHVGTYSFVTSDSTHQTAQNILGSDIQADYPWLTVKYDYAIEGCTRKIAELTEEQEGYYKASYEAEYVSTQTLTAQDGTFGGGSGVIGQPTLTLKVKKQGENSGYGSLNENSVFRVWLPNGLELGTGQSAGGVTVANWFESATGAGNNTNGYYGTTAELDGSGKRMFNLLTNPAEPNDSTVGTDHASRETLRRYINLGGWFYVSVCENPNDSVPIWSERIPVYVRPRKNIYTENKEYNFIARNADLMSWPGGVGDTLYLPHGEYETVSKTGLPEYDTITMTSGGTAAGVKVDGTTDATIFTNSNPYDPDWSVVKAHSESYGVTTLYDGQTGAQPGMVYNVKADTKDTATGAKWTSPTTETEKTSIVFTDPQRDIRRYGATKLYEGEKFTYNGVTYEISGFAIPGYGTVFNPDRHTVTLRRDKEPYNPADPTKPDTEKPAQSEKIKLLSVVDNGITRRDLESITTGETYQDRNVALVTFDTQQEGYTIRQSYTLTIKNVGTTDIYGLDINSSLDGYPTEEIGGRFVVTKPPASFLAAGDSTTFELTYVYDLRFNTQDNKEETTYHDILFITSNSHNSPVWGGVNGGGIPAMGSAYPTTPYEENYLLEFEAEFKVTKKPLYQVEVIYRPYTGNMGTANLIVGETGLGSNRSMNYTTTTRTYIDGSTVYVVANLLDEYQVKKVTMTKDGDSSPVSYHIYGQDSAYPDETATLDDNTVVYVFEMPADDVTVVVDFYEPVWSKLRLEKIFDFSTSDEEKTDLVGADSEVHDDPTTQEAGKKPDDVTKHVYKVWRKVFSDAEEAVAATFGTGNADSADLYRMTVGTPMSPEAEATDFKPSENQYIVVIPYDAEWSQVQATLRRVVYHEDWQLTGPTAEDVAQSNDYPHGYNEELEDVEITMELYDTYYPDGTAEEALKNNSFDRGGDAVFNASSGYATSLPKPKAFTGHNDAPASGATGTGTFPPEDYMTSGTTATSSTHTSAVFASPEQGESKYVRITLKAEDEDGSTVERYYYVEIHRATESPTVTMYYGNSPYGMIMNNAAWYGNDTARSEAKAAFDQGMTFDGLNGSKIPAVVLDSSNGLQGVTYWREAWVYNTGLYEPESYTNTKGTLNTAAKPDYSGGNTPPSFAQVDTDPKDDMYSIKHDSDYLAKVKYNMSYNLDKDDYAYFAILGEDFMEPGILEARDSSGRKVDLDKITAKATVKLLDTTGTSQVERFKDDADTVEVTLDLGVAGQRLTDASGGGIATLTAQCWPVSSAKSDTDGDGAADTTTYTLVENIRPGRYLIEYTFPDYNGVDTLTVYRPLVILSKVGDVDADLDRTAGSNKNGDYAKESDEYRIEDRVTDPLGYAAGGWDSANGKETGYPAANLFKFRVCDVNNDRNVNNIDANAVQEAVKKSDSTWLRFYHPTNYGRPNVGSGYNTTTP